MSGKVARYYDDNVQKEQQRLSRDFFSGLEKRIVLHLIDSYFPGHGRLLDVGGGPGTYARELLDRGYDVTLVDLSPKAVEEARRCAAGHPRFRALVLDAREVGSLGQHAFDCVMVMGPFYHLLTGEERRRALDAAWTVLKPGGVLMGAAIGFYAAIAGLIERRMFDFFISDDVPLDPRLDGYPYVMPEGQGLADFYMTRPGPFRAFFEERGFRTLSLAGSKGIFTYLGEALNAAPPEVQEKATAITLATCEDPDIVGLSNHFFYVGQKPPADA
ncbi:MAG: class I SAM-dependent methyltransferase [Anaerolineae bacterium]|jgi:SAM-dependent methyltransferase